MKYAQDMNWSYKDDIDFLIIFCITGRLSMHWLHSFSIVNIDILLYM